MKLLVYSHYFAPSIGGVETIVMSLARGLAELRTEDGSPEFDLTLVTHTSRGEFDDGALPFRVVRKPGFRRLWKLVRQADVLHVAGPALLPLVLGLLARKPSVIEHHGFQAICPTGQLLIESSGEPCPGYFMAGRWRECWNCDPTLGWFAARRLWLLTFVRQWVCKRVAANIMPTSWLGEQLQLPRATTIHHGLVHIQGTHKETTARPEVPIIAFQGRLVSTKGAGILLEAAKILCEEGCEFRIVIIGDGPERAKLETRARQAPLSGRVQFTGRLAADELEKILHDTTMMVVPSLGGEVFGLVVAENMQRGLPVIASDLGAFVEVLGDAGRTFSVGNASALTHQLKELLNSVEYATRLATQARNRAQKSFSLTTMVNKHTLLYRSVVRRGQ
jgi:glycosyltransferase involved in cell wall biosynthesis